MTADWRATLERVAEKLAEIQSQARANWRSGYAELATEALADIRGLLAEPQPDEVIVRDLPYDGRIGALAEPQVNPSEAKGGRAIDVVVYEDGVGQWHWRLVENGRTVEASTSRFVSKVGATAVAELHARNRAGLLAEGEESRKPDDELRYWREKAAYDVLVLESHEGREFVDADTPHVSAKLRLRPSAARRAIEMLPRLRTKAAALDAGGGS